MNTETTTVKIIGMKKNKITFTVETVMLVLSPRTKMGVACEEKRKEKRKENEAERN